MNGCAETFRPYRRLAGRIIRLAFQDAKLRSDLSHGKSARAFLAGSSMLHFWCEIASLDAQFVARRALTIQRPHVTARGTHVAS